jgi:hypothetical protein
MTCYRQFVHRQPLALVQLAVVNRLINASTQLPTFAIESAQSCGLG